MSVTRSPFFPITALATVASLAVAAPARAEERPGSREELEARIAALIARPGGLTAVDAGRRAAATSREVEARHADVDAAVASLNQTLAGFAPRLSGLARYQRFSHISSIQLGFIAEVDPGSKVQLPAGSKSIGSLPSGTPLVAVPFSFPIFDDNTVFSATLTLPITDYIFRLGQAYLSARHARDSAKLQAEAAQRRARSDAEALYFTWARARLQTVVAEQALAQSTGHLGDVKQQFAVGQVSQADVLRVESQVAQAELLVERARNAASVTEEQLHIALHDGAAEGAETLAIGDDLNAPVDSAISAEPHDALVREALRSRPEVRALTESKSSLEQQAASLRAGWFPQIVGIADAVYANPLQRIIPPQQQFDSSWDVGAQVSWSPNDAAIADAGVKNVAARARSLESQRQQLEDAIRAEVAQARSALREALVNTQTTARGLAAAEESYRVRRALFANGRATSVELTDAETDLTRARFDAINARLDVRVGLVRLRHAVGRDGSGA